MNKKSSRSIAGKDFPSVEMLDARIASALNKIIQKSHFKKKVRPTTEPLVRLRNYDARKEGIETVVTSRRG